MAREGREKETVTFLFGWLVFVCFGGFCLFVFSRQGLLSSSNGPGTHFVEQVGLEHTEI